MQDLQHMPIGDSTAFILQMPVCQGGLESYLMSVGLQNYKARLILSEDMGLVKCTVSKKFGGAEAKLDCTIYLNMLALMEKQECKYL